jgi:hypothetical protein
VGGLITVNTFQKGGGFKLSINGAPWTVGLASIKSVTTTTPNGGTITFTETLYGFAHGPASGSSSTAAPSGSGVLQLVTPSLIQTSQAPPNQWWSAWVQVTLRLPEPGMLLLLGSGVVGLLLLGRSRMRG